MKNIGLKNPQANLQNLGLSHYATAHWNSPVAELVQATLELGEGELADNGALVIRTGSFTGRSPEDRFIVKDDYTQNTVDWSSKFNKPFDPQAFDALYTKLCAYLQGRDLYVRDASVCADPRYRLNLRVIAQKPWSALFAHNMFMRPEASEILEFQPEWHIICAPDFKANPQTDQTRQENFAIVHFSKKLIIIGGTGYTGEMKKGIFSILNYILPQEKQVLSMHCSANVGPQGDTAIFFGLSGTGKTTLSADPNRQLIGDDEHGWTSNTVFNFEGGCYAKTINLSPQGEPQIYEAIRFGALVENTQFFPNTRSIDYTDGSITENTRVSYPLHYIDNALEPALAGRPKNIFFLTCDAFGVLPPISKLTPAQAMFHFISGYTAKVAGTEAGIKEPQSTFSACFGAPFLPLHPTQYAQMLGQRMQEQNVKVWLINTGWSGGAYGQGKRISLSYTRALITAALQGALDEVNYEITPGFGLHIPHACPQVPSEILNPRNTWEDKAAYDAQAQNLANQFVKNFEKYKAQATAEMLEALPQPLEVFVA